MAPNKYDPPENERDWAALVSLVFATGVISAFVWAWQEKKLVKRYGLAIRRYIAWRTIGTAVVGAGIFATLQLVWAWLDWA